MVLLSTLSVGSYYQRKGFRLSAAYHHLAAPTVRLGETHELPIRGVLNVATQYNIRTNSPLFTITPSAMLRSDFTDYRVDLTLRGEYKFENRLIFAGIQLRSTAQCWTLCGWYAPRHRHQLWLRSQHLRSGTRSWAT